MLSQRSHVGAVVSAPIGTPGAGSSGTPAGLWTGSGTNGPDMSEQNYRGGMLVGYVAGRGREKQTQYESQVLSQRGPTEGFHRIKSE